ncbi:LacI family transcriptional regulator [Pontibacter ummariensis]|uniref:Transcriptional regulator, LacI family n=1 Tax=Pontibacter ummariensis TaxID=1610492 RepID=A0A239H4U9_9BACT|nr:LacI family DNA-binding transcriptional regulator [Pontibacter ummariensis]PRY10924.1 LacI family transcriptional regulator [Pontibacter ummariensis]SNS75284.1 transcriptional regulator, LacI family [Pontibacter ummariensis]
MEIKAKVTIHDIAEKLNITASTVSRALNNSPRISETTKKAVLKAAKQMNYQPNNIAAALRNGKSNIIGVIVPTADRAFFASVVRGIEEVANTLDYKVIISQSYDSYEKEVQTIEALFRARVDGIIASIGKNTEDFEHFKKAQQKGMPLVLFDRTTDALEVSQVMIDDYWGAYKIVEHLIEQGCRRIAHFTNPKKVSVFKERLRGYTDALKNNGLPYEEELVVPSNLQLEDGRASMEQLLQLKEVPDAVFSASDFAAMGAMQVLKERSIKIPEQVALAGFSNDPFTSFSDPPLTTVDQLSIPMGKMAAELFFQQLKTDPNKYIPQKTVLKPELVIRKSSLKKEAQLIAATTAQK